MIKTAKIMYIFFHKTYSPFLSWKFSIFKQSPIISLGGKATYTTLKNCFWQMELVLWSSSHSLTSHSTLGICKQASVQFDVCADTGSLETEILSLAWADFDRSSYTAVSPSAKKPRNNWHPLHEDIMRNEVIMVIRCIEPFQGKAIWKHRFSSFTGECLLLLDAAKQWTLLSSCFCPS